MYLSLSRVIGRMGGALRRGAPTNFGSGKRILRRLPPLRSSFWPAGIAGILVLTALVVVGSSSRGETTVTMQFVATQDTFVKNTRPTANYGQEDDLEVDTSPSHKRALVRFPVVGIPSNATIQSATLKLYVEDRSNQAGTVHRVNGSWSESTVWNTAPGIGAQVAAFTGAAERDTWKQTEVKSAVTGNGFVNFYILTGSTDGVDYRASEANHIGPRWPSPGPFRRVQVRRPRRRHLRQHLDRRPRRRQRRRRPGRRSPRRLSCAAPASPTSSTARPGTTPITAGARQRLGGA